MKSLKIGSLTLNKPVVYAPLAGCSDHPFREVASLYSPGLQYCEMVKMEALIRKIPATLKMLEYQNFMRPIGAQLCGSNPSIAGEAATMIAQMGFDVIDLNCGCPVDKVTKDGSGSGLLQHPEVIGEILEEMVKSVDIPVTVKIRIGWDEENINCEQVTQIAEQAGAQAITIHGRTRKQAYKGSARWEYISRCKKQAKTIQVIGNGDLFSYQDALAMFEQTHCDGVCISRGTFGQPWIAEQIHKGLLDQPVDLKTMEDAKEHLLKHFEASTSYKDPKGALIDMRRVSCWYFKNTYNAKKLRYALSHAESLNQCYDLIQAYEP